MVSRSLTDIFLLMRSNAIRNRHIYPEQQDNSDQLHLVSLDIDDSDLTDNNDIALPPQWIDYLEKAQYLLPKLASKIEELKLLYRANLHRTTFDDSSTDELAIEQCTAEISKLFNEGHRIVQIIKSESIACQSSKERLLCINVYRSLASQLQDYSNAFRETQNGYLRQIESREKRSNIYFEDMDSISFEDEIDVHFVKSSSNRAQLLLLEEEEQTKMALEREKEVNAIVKSIMDLNTIFKDLSVMVADQGTVLDRIDYNIEQSQSQVRQGFRQMQQAHNYKKKNRKICAILTLTASTIVFIFLLVLVKS